MNNMFFYQNPQQAIDALKSIAPIDWNNESDITSKCVDYMKVLGRIGKLEFSDQDLINFSLETQRIDCDHPFERALRANNGSKVPEGCLSRIKLNEDDIRKAQLMEQSYQDEAVKKQLYINEFNLESFDELMKSCNDSLKMPSMTLSDGANWVKDYLTANGEESFVEEMNGAEAELNDDGGMD